MNIVWDADKYTSDFAFVHYYGNSVMELIDAAEGSSVLDLGCGNGVLTMALQERGYSAKGLDSSEELLDIARKAYPSLEFMQGDATNFGLSEPVDVVFSNAVFHWIDKDRQCDMLKCVYNALRKKGQFVFEFGGYGNNKSIHEALEISFSKYGYSYKMPFYFPKISEYTSLLENTGFLVKYAALFDRPTELKGENGLRDWIAMFIKSPFLIIKSTYEKEIILNEVEEILQHDLYKNDKWYADYVRLRVKAIRL